MRIKDLRMQLTQEDIVEILSRLGVYPQGEVEAAIIFPTSCHNETGGSPKLYYYKKDKIFKCYTECGAPFDIFELIMKIKRLQGKEINIFQAIDFAGMKAENLQIDEDVLKDLRYLEELSLKNEIFEDETSTILEKDILNNFPFDEIGNSSWLKEGITREAMDRFTIGYYKPLNAITIPNFDHDGNLIGVRGRFLNKDSVAKYMPIKYGDKILSFPTGKYLYGYYENKNKIKQKGMAILFEGEKSVLKMESYYPDNNIALSTSGKKITLHHLNELLKLNINEVILAYDKDYQNLQEQKEKIEEYKKILNLIKPYFDVSLLIDQDKDLDYKDSPIDKGKEAFETMIKYRTPG